MIKAVLFDMDGLMFDTERLTSDIWISIGQKYGYPITMEMMNRMRGLPLQGYLKIFYDELGDDFDYWKYRKIREQETNLYIDTYGVPVKKGLRELLQWLKENNYAVVLATSTHQDAACKLLQKADVYQYFDAFVFGNMVEKGKPNGEIFETAAKAAGIKVEEALVLEDSYAGVEAGWRAGCHVIMIPDMLPCRDIERERIDDCAESLLEIISFLKNNRAEAQLCSAGRRKNE